MHKMASIGGRALLFQGYLLDIVDERREQSLRKNLADFEDLELLVAKIQRELAPTAEVLHNQRLQGRKSGRDRQIDVLVKDRIGQYDIFIVVDCKDYKKPADVKSVEEFYGLVDDVGAQKGVLVCPSGFSAAAKTRAEGLQISLYSPVDTEPHKWTVSPLVPTLFDFRSAGMAFRISMSAPYPFTFPQDFQFSKQITDAEGVGQGSMFETAIDKWNSGKLPIEPGRYDSLQVFGAAPYMENGHGMIVPVAPSLNLHVERKLFYGQMPITRISGFRDEIDGGVITNAFEVGLVSPEEVFNTWAEIDSEDDCELKPVLKVQGLIGWDEKHPDQNSISAWAKKGFEHC